MSDPFLHAAPNERFTTTRWSLILQAGGDDAPAAKTALAELCGRYWYPLYAFVRRQGREPHEAEDLTQAFFVQLLEQRLPASADPERGRFRSYLLGAFKHFIANQRRAELTQKRGGGRITSLNVDAEQGERQYQFEPAHEETPERIFERRWALATLAAALTALRDELAAAGKLTHFETLKPFLDAAGDPSYAQAAGTLKMTETAVRVAVHRLREKYRQHLRQAAAETVASPAEIEAEIRALLAAVAS